MSLLDVAVLGSILIASFGFASVLSRIDLHPALLVLGLGFPAVAVFGIGPLLRADRQAITRLRELEPKVALLAVLDLFADASRTTLERLAGALEDVVVPANHDIVRQGDPADALWVIVDGEVEVTSDGAFIRTMGARSYFGEIGLLHDIPRTATVRSIEQCTLWRLSGDEFFDALQTASASASLVSVSTTRLARTHPTLAVTPLAPAPA